MKGRVMRDTYMIKHGNTTRIVYTVIQFTVCGKNKRGFSRPSLRRDCSHGQSPIYGLSPPWLMRMLPMTLGNMSNRRLPERAFRSRTVEGKNWICGF